MVTFAPGEFGKAFDDLVRRAEKGEEVVVMRDGRPVARLMPAAPDPDKMRALIKRIADLRAQAQPLGASIKSLVEDGRA